MLVLFTCSRSPSLPTACTSPNSGVSPTSPGKMRPEMAPWVPGRHTHSYSYSYNTDLSARRDLRTRDSRRVSHCLLKHFQLRKQVHINIDHFFVSRLITWLNRHVRACSSWSSRLPHWLSREQVGWQSQPRAGYTLDYWTASGFLQIRAKQASHK